MRFKKRATTNAGKIPCVCCCFGGFVEHLPEKLLRLLLFWWFCGTFAGVFSYTKRHSLYVAAKEMSFFCGISLVSLQSCTGNVVFLRCFVIFFTVVYRKCRFSAVFRYFLYSRVKEMSLFCDMKFLLRALLIKRVIQAGASRARNESLNQIANHEDNQGCGSSRKWHAGK